MWRCDKCGTQSDKPAACSGCGSFMTRPPEEAKFQFVVVVPTNINRSDPARFAVYGPFPTILAADAWAEMEFGVVSDGSGFEVVLMENPNG